MYNHFLFNLPVFFGATLNYNKTKYLSFVDVIMASLYKFLVSKLRFFWAIKCFLKFHLR